MIVLKIDVADRLFEINPELSHREIAEVLETARKALAEVRSAVAGYRAEGLAAEVARARRALASAGVQLATDVEPLTLTDSEETTVCLMLREAVTNVIRHAEATLCQLEVRGEGRRLRISVQDNGKGVVNAEGNGLRGMRERLRQSGGSMTLDREHGTGTRLAAELPLTLKQARDLGPMPADLRASLERRVFVQNEGKAQI